MSQYYLKVNIGGYVYFLECGDYFYIHSAQDDTQSYLIKDGNRHLINTKIIISDKQDNICPIGFGYKNDCVVIKLAEFANIHILTGITKPVSSGERVAFDASKDCSQMYISRDKSNTEPKQKIQFEEIEVDESEESLSENIMNPYGTNSDVNDNRFKYVSDLKKMDYILSRELDANSIGMGNFRKVYDISGLNPSFLQDSDGDIIKLAKEKDKNRGIKANREEFQTWQVVKNTEISRFFCPITSKGSDHKYIVMKKAKTSSNDIQKVSKNYTNIDSHNNYVDLIRDILRTSIIDPDYNVNDIGADNVGELNGRNVIIDYQFGGGIKVDESRLYGKSDKEKEQEIKEGIWEDVMY
jgi:hypothetical protein